MQGTGSSDGTCSKSSDGSIVPTRPATNRPAIEMSKEMWSITKHFFYEPWVRLLQRYRLGPFGDSKSVEGQRPVYMNLLKDHIRSFLEREPASAIPYLLMIVHGKKRGQGYEELTLMDPTGVIKAAAPDPLVCGKLTKGCAIKAKLTPTTQFPGVAYQLDDDQIEAVEYRDPDKRNKIYHQWISVLDEAGCTPYSIYENLNQVPMGHAADIPYAKVLDYASAEQSGESLSAPAHEPKEDSFHHYVSEEADEEAESDLSQTLDHPSREASPRTIEKRKNLKRVESDPTLPDSQGNEKAIESDQANNQPANETIVDAKPPKRPGKTKSKDAQPNKKPKHKTANPKAFHKLDETEEERKKKIHQAEKGQCAMIGNMRKAHEKQLMKSDAQSVLSPLQESDGQEEGEDTSEEIDMDKSHQFILPPINEEVHALIDKEEQLQSQRELGHNNDDDFLQTQQCLATLSTCVTDAKRFQKELVVLSLFDGIGGAIVALLKNLGIPIKAYIIVEKDELATGIVRFNFPPEEFPGLHFLCNRVENVTEEMLREVVEKFGPVDLLIGGSPCTDVSILGKKKGLNNPEGESKYFWDFVRIMKLLKRISPQHKLFYMLENVASMRKKDKGTISNAMGVEPQCINSDKRTNVSRRRYYWHNLPFSTKPLGPNEHLSEILSQDGEALVPTLGCITSRNCVMTYRDMSLEDVLAKGPKYARRYCIIHIRGTHKVRSLSASEIERILGFTSKGKVGTYTAKALIKGKEKELSENERKELLGRSFDTGVIAYVLEPLIKLCEGGELEQRLENLCKQVTLTQIARKMHHKMNARNEESSEWSFLNDSQEDSTQDDVTNSYTNESGSDSSQLADEGSISSSRSGTTECAPQDALPEDFDDDFDDDDDDFRCFSQAC